MVTFDAKCEHAKAEHQASLPPKPCAHLVAYDSWGKLARPRPCKRLAVEGGDFCGVHKVVAKRWAPIAVSDGGFCVFCAEAGRSYSWNGVRMALCTAHGRALRRAIAEGR
jgi:hypothetical protein